MLPDLHKKYGKWFALPYFGFTLFLLIKGILGPVIRISPEVCDTVARAAG